MNNNQINQQQVFVEEDTIDIRKLLFTLRRGWYFFLIFPLIMGIAAYLYVKYTVPQYEVKGSILIKTESQGTDMLSQQLSGVGMGPSPQIVDEAKIIQSRSIMEEVVEDLKLQSKVYKDGRIKDTDLYGKSPIVIDTFAINDTFILRKPSKGSLTFKAKILNSNEYVLIKNDIEYQGVFDSLITNKYGSFLFRYNPNVNPNANDLKHEYVIKLSTTFNTVLKYKKKLELAYDNESSLVVLSMKDVVPQRSEDIINKVINVYNFAAVEDKNAMGKNTLEFIDERLYIITDELQGVERGVQAVKEKEGITVNPGSDLTFLYGEIGKYGQKLTDLEVEKQILSDLNEYLRQANNKYELVPFNLVKNEALAQMVVNLNEAIQKRKRLLQSATVDNPNVVALDEEIANYRFQLRENIKNLLSDMDKAIRKIKSRSSDFEARLSKTPRKERELLEVKRQQYIKENLYLFLLEKREETAISLAATTDNARIIDSPALSQTKPIYPQKIPILAGALFFGLALAIGTIVLREFLIDTIQSENDIKEMTQVPILGAIAESKKDSRIVVTKSSRSAIAEMFRLLRTNLQFTLAGEPHKTMLVTSSMSGEGKSFICINLAMSFALSGKKVVIIGLDLRKPKMASYLNDNVPNKGISSYLINAATKDEIINQYEGNDNFYFIASGPIPPNPSELILNGRIEVLIEELKTEYDVIIIDTPPVGLVTDSLLLKSMVNASIYVTRFGVTKKGQLNFIDQLYKENRFNNPTIVLNSVKRGNNYGYGYGSGYGYGYYEEDK
ncbi:MAG: GumC family protein [Saprospiraceae bacterium]